MAFNILERFHLFQDNHLKEMEPPKFSTTTKGVLGLFTREKKKHVHE